MRLSFVQTKALVDLVLGQPEESARRELHIQLQKFDHTEGEFYEGIVRHGAGLRLSTDQWFNLLCRLPNRVLRSDLDLPGILSEEQIKRLPPITG